MAAISLYHFLLLTLFPTLGSAGRDACKVDRCGHKGPTIHFPFQLDFHQLEHYDYPGFTLTCNPNHQTVLQLPSSVNLLVKNINYKLQTIDLQDPNNCLPKQLPNLNLSNSPFAFTRYSECLYNNFSLLNCSPPERDQHNNYNFVPCLSVGGYRVYAINYYDFSFDSTSCVKISGISSVPYYLLRGVEHHKGLHLAWSEPSCEVCEARGKRCGFKKYTSPVTVATQCLDIRKTTKVASKRLVAVLALGPIFLVLIGTALYYTYASHRKQNEDQIRIDKFLEDYTALKPTRYSFADVKKITNQFKNKLGEGGYGTVFKGKLSSEVFVAVKVLNDSTGNGEEFMNEVGTMARIHHVNMVRLVAFCADETRQALVYEFLRNDSLEKFIFSQNRNNNTLGWEKLQDSVVGIAKGIEYLHQGCDHHEYSFEMMLLEMVGGRKNTDATVQNTSQVYFPEWVYNRLCEGEELGIKAEEEEHGLIAKRLTVVGLWCIQWYPMGRPSMKTVVQMLEGKGDTLSMPPNPFDSTKHARALDNELPIIAEAE
ncbi:hypothetical protein RJ640_028608 [Escallonia rubra]|uniref:Protein kinase domain-containing protein n=1 Tax=Escallonia rubra TaxID=112253 RepID=A0AA88UJD4_9ASTE|nr:hypothetical protein RJ640_028608 [Escallonia rubra]